tara:strand:- start:151 stop:474 length:324 start_codon:yes stop_codon:yes gene_type:complete
MVAGSTEYTGAGGAPESLSEQPARKKKLQSIGAKTYLGDIESAINLKAGKIRAMLATAAIGCKFSDSGFHNRYIPVSIQKTAAAPAPQKVAHYKWLFFRKYRLPGST